MKQAIGKHLPVVICTMCFSYLLLIYNLVTATQWYLYLMNIHRLVKSYISCIFIVDLLPPPLFFPHTLTHTYLHVIHNHPFIISKYVINIYRWIPIYICHACIIILSLHLKYLMNIHHVIRKFIFYIGRRFIVCFCFSMVAI